jgi:hypothetical protein
MDRDGGLEEGGEGEQEAVIYFGADTGVEPEEGVVEVEEEGASATSDDRTGDALERNQVLGTVSITVSNDSAVPVTIVRSLCLPRAAGADPSAGTFRVVGLPEGGLTIPPQESREVTVACVSGGGLTVGAVSRWVVLEMVSEESQVQNWEDRPSISELAATTLGAMPM